MEEWKIRQHLYHKINLVWTDDLTAQHIVISETVVDDAVRYFVERDLGWIYPSKSYMVGICYARWIAEVWGGDPMTHLNDPDLLHGNDPYFVPYAEDPDTYDAILAAIGGWTFDTSQGMVPDVRGYFVDEFMLDFDVD